MRRGQTLRLEPEAWRQLKMLAIEQGTTSHDLLIQAVRTDARAAELRLMILLDTNVVSELMKSAPEPAVMAWVNAIPGRPCLFPPSPRRKSSMA